MAKLAALLVCVFLSTNAWGAIGIDATSFKDQAPASTTVTTPVFSTAAGQELMLAFISTDYLSGTNTTVQGVSGGGLTWVLVGRANAQSGTSEIWRAFAAAPLSGATVTATLSQRVISSLTVISFSGADPSGANGSGAIGAVANASSPRGAPSATLVTRRNNSLIFGVGNDYDNAIARTPNAGQSIIHQYLTSVGDTYWVQNQNAPVPASGTTVTLGDTAPATDRYNLVICEILADAGVAVPGWTVSGALFSATDGSGATLLLSGTSTGSATADSNGKFSFTGLANGPYTIRPQKSGFSFLPSNQTVTVSGGNVTGIDFSVSPVRTYSISGSITPSNSGTGTVVTLGGPSTASATADSNGAFTFAGLGNGTYTVTPAKSGYAFSPPSQSVSLNGGDVSGIGFVASASGSNISIDANVSKDQGVASTTIATGGFSTNAPQELLLALISTDYLGGANTTVQGITGGGLTWILVGRANAQSGTSEIWRAFAQAPLNGAVVTATLSQQVSASMTLLSFTGVDTSGSNGSGAIGAVSGASSAKGAPKATLITTRANSWVIGVGNDFDNPIARTLGPGQTLLHQYLAPVGDTYWMQNMAAPSGAAGTAVTLNDTAPAGDRFNLVICEILSGTGGGPVNPVPPVITMASPAEGVLAGLSTVSANAAPGSSAIASVQFLLDGAALGNSVATAPYSITWDSSTALAGAHTLSAVVRDGAGQTASASPINVTVDNSGNPAVVGSWSTAVNLPAVAVNLILLRNNKVLFYQDGQTASVWDYLQNTFTPVPIGVNLFCSGAALMGDGRVFIAGGFGNSGSAIGIADAEIFDPVTNSWTTVPKMTYKRWYPTVTALGDGKMLVTAGWQTSAHTNAGISEVYDPLSNSWTRLTNANNPFETYPFLYLLGDGRVIHIGGSEYATDTDVLDIPSQTWSVIDGGITDGASATMYLPDRFVKAGAAADSQNVGPATNTTFALDLTQASPKWQQTPSMAYPRSFMNMTMLPDGSVLATGGELDQDGGDVSKAVYAAENWSPRTKTWTTLAAMHKPREYHGTALLLPDGRVLESGMGADFGNVPEQKSAEFFSPPYLFKGARPIVTQTPASAQYGSTFFTGTPDGADIASAVLIRTGAATHAFDENERFVPVAFQQTSGGLNITAPANGNLAPPGYYMLFLVNSKGVPSVAPFIRLSN